MKRMLSLFLALILSLSLAWGAAPAYALRAADASEDTGPQVTTNDVDNSVSEASYPMDKVDKDTLVSHTDKTSELKDGTPDYPKGEDAVSLSCSEGVYEAMGWNAGDLTNSARSYASDENNQNPLSGYAFVTPDELMIGMVNLDSDHQTNIKTINDQAVANAGDLDGDLGDLSTAVSDQNWTQDDHDQTHNAVGVDVDGDGSDEYAYLTLYEGYKHTDWSGDSCLKVELFDAVDGSWAKLCEIGYDMDDSSNCYVNDILAGVAKGYAVIEAGNFDHDAAGTEELAVYLPDREGDDCPWARVVILKYEGNQLTEKDSIKLNTILDDYGKLGDKWYLPTVSLSTSSLRLGNPVETKGAYHYEPYTDLVINVSMPKHYRGDGLNMNSSTTICQFGSDCKISSKKTFEYSPFGITSGNETRNVRMTAVSSCEADLNGDGYKELVVAGIEESGLGALSSTDYGEYSSSCSLVNIICYNGSEYELVWGTPKEADAPGTLGPEDFDDVVSPVALCGGHFDPRTPPQRDQLCLQGVFLRCDGALITGPANYVNKTADGSVAYCIIVNTSPYKEKENFPYSDVSFTNLNNGVNLPDKVGAENDEAWISCCETGAFLSSAGTECVAMITSDKRDGMPDQIYMDAIVASIDESGEVKYTGYNDILGGSRDEDDCGTCLFLCFLNCDDDAYYYRYTGTYSSWSAPVLFSVIQVPPYYREANGITNIQFDISSGVTDTMQVNVSLGFQITYAGQVKIPLIGTFGTQSGFGINAGYSHAWSNSKTITNTIRLYADQDYALAYVVPVLVNTYDIIRASEMGKDGYEPEYYEVREPLDPIFTALSVDEYNAALDNNEAHNDIQLPADYSAPRLTDQMLARSGAGDPMAYESDVDTVIQTGPKEGEEEFLSIDEKKDVYAVDNGTAVSDIGPSMGSNMALGTSSTNTGSLTGNISLGYVIGTQVLGQSAKITPTLTATAGFSGGRTNSSTVKYTVLYQGIPKTLPDGVAFDSGDSRYDGMDGDSKITHYDPSAKNNALSYNYTATAVAYPIGNYKTDLSLLRGTNPEDMDPSFTIYELSYATQGYDVTPEPPRNVTVQRAQLNTPEILGNVPQADGSAVITLAWDSAVRNQARAPYGYNVYMVNAQSSGAGPDVIYLQNREGPVRRNPDGNYTNCTLRLEKDNYSDHCVFYVVPVFEELVNGQMQITEGVLTGKCEVDSLKTLVWGAAVHFTEQPENVVLRNDSSSQTAVFTAAAEKSDSLSGDMRFDWQTWNRTTRKWTTVYTETKAGKTSTTEFRRDLSGAEKAAQIDVPVRCVVTCGNNSAQSAIVACVYQKDPELLIGNGYKVYDGKPADPPAVRCASEGAVTYTWFRDDMQLSSAPVDAGSYVCRASVAETEAYRAGEASGTVTIDPAQPAVTLSGVQVDARTTVTAEISGLLEADGEVMFVVTKEDGTSVTFDSVKVEQSGGKYLAVLTDAQAAGGDYTVWAIYTGDSGNYRVADAEKKFRKNKLTRAVTISQDSYTVNVGCEVFNLQPTTDTAPDSADWSYEVIQDTWKDHSVAGTQLKPSVTVTGGGLVMADHAGKSVIRITLTDPNGLYEDAEATVTVDVLPAPLTVTSFASPSSAVYGRLDGVTYGLTYTLEDGTPVENFRPAVGSLSAVPVAEDADASKTPYLVEINPIGATVDSDTMTYPDVFLSRDYDPLTYVQGTLTVTPADLSDPESILVTKPADVTYTGADQKQPVTVKTAEGAVLTEGKDYTLTYSGDPDLVNAGSTVTVTVTGIGNYTGYQKTDYQILEGSGDSSGSGSSGGSGGGGGGAAAAPANPVSVPSYASGEGSHGSVKASAASARAGENVTLTVTPDEGYRLDKLTVTDTKGNAIQLTKNADGTYGFIMPDSGVEIAAAFVEALSTRRFDDVPEDAWYVDAVAWAVERGVMNGVSETLFAPNDPCTRAMVVTMLWRLAGEPASDTASPFTDVKAGSWYAEAVNWAAETGAVKGTSETTFSPDTPVTREQLAALLYRYAQARGKGFTGAWMFPLAFPDAADVSEYADEAMHWMTMHGIINGMGDGTLAPRDNATRAQIAAMFMRFAAEMEK